MARNSENIAGAISAVNGIVSAQTEALAQIKTTLASKTAGASDISLGLTGASVGDIIKVKQVDADGKPTEWEAVTAKLANPNALTFTGAVTGSYDGSAPVSVEIPSGGGATEREWTVLGEIDISVVGGGNIELTGLDNFTEFYVTWETVVNESTSASGYNLYINDIGIALQVIPIQKTSEIASYGWIIARYNGLVWEFQKSSGAVLNSNINLNSSNALFPYNLILGVGKATKFKLLAPVPTYRAVSGIITIYGR